MIKMINRLTGTEMWVSDNRVAEYKAAGHKLAANTQSNVAKIEEPKTEPDTEPKTTVEKPRRSKKGIKK